MSKSSFSEQGARSGIPIYHGSRRRDGCAPTWRVSGWGALLAVVVCFLSVLPSGQATLTVLAYHGMSASAAPSVIGASNSSYVFNPTQVQALERSVRFETVSGSSAGVSFRRGPMPLSPVPEGTSLFPLIGIISLALIGHHLMRGRESFRAFWKNIFRRQASAL